MKDRLDSAEQGSHEGVGAILDGRMGFVLMVFRVRSRNKVPTTTLRTSETRGSVKETGKRRNQTCPPRESNPVPLAQRSAILTVGVGVRLGCFSRTLATSPTERQPSAPADNRQGEKITKKKNSNCHKQGAIPGPKPNQWVLSVTPVPKCVSVLVCWIWWLNG